MIEPGLSDSERAEIHGEHGLAIQIFSRSHEEDQRQEEKIQELDSDDSDAEEERMPKEMMAKK
jgi:hypothetical protein